MRTLILCLLLLISYASAASEASAYRSEPDGFKEMKWGAPIGSQFSKDDFVGFSIDEKSSRYLKISDSANLEVDGVKLYSMVYSYFNERFWKVELEARLLQAAKLMDAFIGKYGEPSRVTQISEFSTEYSWTGTATDIVLIASLNFYDRKTADIATATIRSSVIKSKIDADVDHALIEKKLPIDAINGFRGRKWGSGFNSAATYLALEQEPHFDYLIKGDDMVFEGVHAQEIRYRFYNNSALQKVELHFKGRQKYLQVKEACFRLFGTTSRYEQGEIRWVGKKTTVSLSFTIDSGGEWLSRLNYMGYGSQ